MSEDVRIRMLRRSRNDAARSPDRRPSTMRPRAAAAISSISASLSAKSKIEHVLRQPLDLGGARNDDDALLHEKAQAHLRRRSCRAPCRCGLSTSSLGAAARDRAVGDHRHADARGRPRSPSLVEIRDASRSGCRPAARSRARTASSISGTVKFDTPMWRASPSLFILHSAPIVSASGTCGFGQWISSRSTSDSRSRARLSLAARSSSRRREMRRPHLGGDEHLVARDARGAQRLADLALVVVHLRRVDVAIAEPQRLLDDARAGAPAQLPGAETDQRNTRAVRVDDLHHKVPR